MCSTCAQAYSPLGKGTRQVLEDRTVSSVAQRRGRTNAQVPIASASCPVAIAVPICKTMLRCIMLTTC